MHHHLASYPGEPVLDHSKGRDYAARNDRPWLSIKCMFGGSARYQTDEGQHYVVDDRAFLVLNERHAYSIEKYARKPVETFCVFFPPALAAGAIQALRADADALLEADEAPQRLIEKRYLHGGEVSARLMRLRAASTADKLTDAGLEEELYALLGALLDTEGATRQEALSLPAVRASTRLELYRRVAWARDFAHAHTDQPVSLACMAGAARMSPYHFLRVFKAATGMTPAAYMTRERLNRAAALLRGSAAAVTEIAGAVGFESLPSFSAAFRRRFGCSPLQYRKTIRD